MAEKATLFNKDEVWFNGVFRDTKLENDVQF